MAVLDALWNCFLLMLFLGILKAALSFYWPAIGEWRYDDLHPSLRYHESCRAKQLLVNGVFFVVYPCVLLYRWYNSRRWTLWTECSEKDDIMQFVEYSREEEELLRHGMIRGRMIVQTEIVLSGALEDELSSSYQKYDDVDDCVVGVVKQPLGEENTPSECVPLNLSKDGEGLDNEELILPECRREERAKVDTTLSSGEEDGDDDEIRLIPSPSSRANDASVRIIAETLIK